jgi:hypothetical protein
MKIEDRGWWTEDSSTGMKVAIFSLLSSILNCFVLNERALAPGQRCAHWF